jgi:hypothetical protein
MADDAKTPSDDVVLVGGPTEDGEGAKVLRLREERVETGEVRPLKDGQPLVGGEIVKLARRGKSRLCDVEVLAKVGKADEGAEHRTGPGPAQVATRAYRESWERIFGRAEESAERVLN